MHRPEEWMQVALSLARTAANMAEVPVGALVVKDGRLISTGFNLRETDHCSTRHAEILAIEGACERLKTWRLTGCELYVSLEPCLMCAGAIYQSRLDKVFFGALDPKAGATGSLYKVHEDRRLNHTFAVHGEVLANESSELLKSFFRLRRA